jgi:hypothetical protein
VPETLAVPLAKIDNRCKFEIAFRRRAEKRRQVPAQRRTIKENIQPGITVLRPHQFDVRR